MPPPDPPSLDAAVLLVARLRALMGDIAHTRRLLEPIPDTLRGAVDARVGTALHRLERRLARIRDCETAERAWAHVHVLALELAELGDESLALAAGALLRGAGADHGACAYADRLIAEILARTPLPWSSFTVPATEAYYVRKTQVVRVRVGAAWFWELPVAAHELGHYAGPTISYEAGGTTIHPVERMLDRARTTQPVSWSWLNEIFADVFAVWTVGPAYALACVFDRFEPIYSDEGTDTHPAASVRVAVLRRVLDHLDAEAYATVGARLDTAWQAMRAASGAKPASDEDIALAAGWCDEVLDLLDEHLLLARWDGWWRARQLATDLAGSGVVATAGHDMRTVLNGGWLARLDGGDEVDTRTRTGRSGSSWPANSRRTTCGRRRSRRSIREPSRRCAHSTRLSTERGRARSAPRTPGAPTATSTGQVRPCSGSVWSFRAASRCATGYWTNRSATSPTS